MLVLTRRPGEALRIGDDIAIRILEVGRGQVRVAIDAPREIPVHREEVWEQVRDANVDAARNAAGGDAAELWRRTRGSSRRLKR